MKQFLVLLITFSSLSAIAAEKFEFKCQYENAFSDGRYPELKKVKMNVVRLSDNKIVNYIWNSDLINTYDNPSLGSSEMTNCIKAKGAVDQSKAY